MLIKSGECPRGIILAMPKKIKRSERINKKIKMNKLNVIDWVALVLLIVGGLNWSLSVF